jgi:hypothetical protein
LQLDQHNKIVQLCAQGMELEGKGQPTEAAIVFLKAWYEAQTDFEKFTAAHYVARHQQTIDDKLHWDKTALQHALNIQEQETVKAVLPSLYLNIAKCHEDLGDIDQAKTNYRSASASAAFLPDDGYGTMIKKGIANGLQRTGA